MILASTPYNITRHIAHDVTESSCHFNFKAQDLNMFFNMVLLFSLILFFILNMDAINVTKLLNRGNILSLVTDARDGRITSAIWVVFSQYNFKNRLLKKGHTTNH